MTKYREIYQSNVVHTSKLGLIIVKPDSPAMGQPSLPNLLFLSKKWQNSTQDLTYPTGA